MKCRKDLKSRQSTIVTPFVGVWIEMSLAIKSQTEQAVTPFVGVWIEITSAGKEERVGGVTPFVGVWIEISVSCPTARNPCSHSLRGSVD